MKLDAAPCAVFIKPVLSPIGCVVASPLRSCRTSCFRTLALLLLAGVLRLHNALETSRFTGWFIQKLCVAEAE